MPLIIAVRNRDVNRAKFLVQSCGASVNMPDRDGITPLSHAVIERNVEMVKVLVQNGAKVDAADNYGFTPLMEASAGRYLEVVKVLVENLNDPKDIDDLITPAHRFHRPGADYDWTALMIAAEVEDLEIIRILLKGGAKEGYDRILLIVIETKKKDLFKTVIEAADKALLRIAIKADEEELLRTAIEANNGDVVDFLAERMSYEAFRRMFFSWKSTPERTSEIRRILYRHMESK
uniref:Uncharacterized protein n=1 Tax=Chromera velia CCMP2878 TaxID=1169474 RepID=A0A0G4HQ91_9ALVE|eukprot:Cvel_7920.t1-p1 / transcript=Cvel_7920.t1 / gene=Cvel_7920 / organism=Chromera_velia_CCMP2878 / gene_product=Protein phosphatase 1 regulatory subunit 12A, putative / transcript_product=Protein phosphatase 1 regulatory subunit 12A, putative / location=Cvel_scaffold424:77325-78023(-) / protein_length=233 / sequence_SO=supercontig / SO=protein_coding / is_pseudo=false